MNSAKNAHRAPWPVTLILLPGWEVSRLPDAISDSFAQTGAGSCSRKVKLHLQIRECCLKY